MSATDATVETTAPRPVMIFAGGTGGHIFPGLAVAATLRERGIPVVWLGAEGAMETRLVPLHGLPIETIAISGVRGKGLGALLAAPFRLLSAVAKAREVLRRHQPRAVISFGGFAAGPGGIAAALARIPLVVHEQNRAPGMTNRVLSRLARHVLTGFPDTFPGRETVVGNPVRDVIAAVRPPAQREDGHPELRILVLGGSQGARALNAGVPHALLRLHDIDYDVRHQCGEKMREETDRAYSNAAIAASVEPFIANMAEAYAWADVVVCRAGALTLAELCAVGVPAILVPLPTAVDDHQTKNAQFLVERGAAILVKQDDALPDGIAAALRALATDPEHRRAMAEAARALALPAAADRVADAVLEAAGDLAPAQDSPA